MLQLLKENWLAICLIVIFVIAYLYKKYKENEDDKTIQYTLDNIGGVFYSLKSGETWLCFKYNKGTQTNKVNFILNNIKQDMELPNEYGYNYIISELLNTEYYDETRDSKGAIVSKNGPYIVFKVIPKTEMKKSSIAVERISGDVQIATGNSKVYKNISNSDFTTKINNYKDIMINNGILEEDINVVLSNPKDDDVKKSFLSKYGIDLAKIVIDVGGKAISFLSYLKS
ncbi:hypothetical protein JZO79_00280 [Vagococcus fluvialis]|uniref:hypothetical protein n=1 Tax=Vagococcus fluvialis TaxID=2738 RepID=UPI001A8E9F70|nr:hypothetical protein [Vagococcus fluvialis]MBO0442027.1 hypothetical protein [Vagococcus fluvialis]